MASYTYDETGNMALFFIITVLFMILAPITLSQISLSPRGEIPSAACECSACIDKRTRMRKHEEGSILRPNITKKVLFITLGWVAFGLLSYKAATTKIDNKIYDPFEILGIKTSSSEKDIKSHFKKLSKTFHPDKVKLSGNDTAESVAAHFVDITKAYKALTDATIRKNFEDYGHPDGRQEITMGIALPPWIVEAHNNIWVLGFYGVLFGVGLPAIVGNWWFGSRRKTKDGVFTQTATGFWKALTETSDVDEVISAIGRATEWETIAPRKEKSGDSFRALERSLETELGPRWARIRQQFQRAVGKLDARWDSLILLYAHLLRLPIEEPLLQKRQTHVLLQTPALLNALLVITTARNWSQPTIATMRLHAYLAQAILPGSPGARWAQLPGSTRDFADVIAALEKREDHVVADARKTVERWGRVEIVDASFRVIDERIVTPQALVHLVMKLRISPPKPVTVAEANGNTDPKSRPAVDAEDDTRLDDEFLNNPKDVEDLKPPARILGSAHAPLWPSNHKPGWWVVLADAKSDRLVVPPMKVTDVPFADPARARDYRSYKLKFQAPPGTGLFTWRVIVVSDTYIGEDAAKDIQLRVEEFTALNADEQHKEDEISDPEEDSLAGQMAAMRGGSVKKRKEESDDESSTDDEAAANDSSSDSD
ncbi:Sec63 Brl domain-containing protein [Multifurca ochricompacta]|uniref:Sec63 Brl domain-containing protein n=1 Tax=Multifurca ochricompacta TaxID=376703 RepID=A0AAD4M5R9_9AGAM|nr:Sec63 Brl domain-containing protein [Multifurca ochricompacta]